MVIYTTVLIIGGEIGGGAGGLEPLHFEKWGGAEPPHFSNV